MLPKDRRVEIRLLDVTMLADDLGMELDDIPQHHPDAGKFLPKQFDLSDRFGLVFLRRGDSEDAGSS